MHLSPLFIYMGCCEDYLTCDIAFNVVMPLSRASTRGRYSRIEGVTEVFAQVKTYQVPITNSYPSHYIICHLPLVFLSPTSPLPFYSPFFRPSLSACFLFACVLDCLLVMMAQDSTKLCDFANTNNNDFISTPIAPLTDAESCHERSVFWPS